MNLSPRIIFSFIIIMKIPIALSAAGLCDAAGAGDTEQVQAYLDAGADLNTTYSNQKTPLIWAVEHNQINMVKMLIDAGANIEGKTLDAYRSTPLIIAAWEGHNTIVQMLLNAGAKIQVADAYGETPLHMAADEGHLNMVKILLQAGANKEAVNNEGNTPLYHAAFMGHPDIVKIIAADFIKQGRRNVETLKILLSNTRFPIIIGARIARSALSLPEEGRRLDAAIQWSKHVMDIFNSGLEAPRTNQHLTVATTIKITTTLTKAIDFIQKQIEELESIKAHIFGRPQESQP